MTTPPEITGYCDLEQVAKGGFGVVYRASQERFDRVVALKVLSVADLDDTARRRFERECRAMGNLSWHPNVVAVYDSGIAADGHPYLAMEFLQAGSLADRLGTGPMPWSEAVRAGVQVAGALGAAHAAGTLHRDLKPENLLVGNFGETKLGDFGIAAVEGSGATTTGHASYTVAHVAPEILRGHRPDERSDIYGLASTIFTLVSGAPPFSGEPDGAIAATITRVLQSPAPRLETVPAALADLLERGLAKEPEGRPQSAVEFGRLLQNIEQAQGVPVTDFRLAPTSAPMGAPGDHAALNVTDPLESTRPQGDPAATVAGVGVAAALSGETISVPPAPVAPAPVSPPVPSVSAAPVAVAPVAVAPVAVAPVAVAPVPAAPPVSVPPAPAGTPSGGSPAGPATPASSKRRPVLIGAVVLLLLVAAAAVLLSRGGDDGSGGDAGDAGGRGGDSGEVGTVTATVSVGGQPRGIAVGDGAAWTANRDDGTVSRIDTATNEVTATVTVGEGPRDVAIGLGSVWLTSLEAKEVARLDPADGTVLDTIAFDGGPQAVTTAGGLVWVTDRADNSVVAIDPDSLTEVAEITVGADPAAVVADGDSTLWVTNREDGTLSKVDIDQRAVVGTFDVGDEPGEAAVDAGGVWLASEGSSALLRIDKESGEIVDQVDIGLRVEGVALDDDGHPWVDGAGQVLEIDPEALEVLGEVEVGGSLREVSFGDGALWTSPHGGTLVTRIDPT